MSYRERKVVIASYSPPKTEEAVKQLVNNNLSTSEPPPKPKRYNSYSSNINSTKFPYPNYISKNFDDINFNVNKNY